MADMGFLPEVARLLDQSRPTARRCSSRPPSTATSTCWSATTRRNPARHERRVDRGRRRRGHPPVLATSPATDRVAAAPPRSSTRLGPTIVFSRTKHGADRLAKQLEPGRRRAPRPSTATAPRPSASGRCAAFAAGEVARARRHRRRRPRHPRRRRGLRRALRPAGRRQGLRPPLRAAPAAPAPRASSSPSSRPSSARTSPRCRRS